MSVPGAIATGSSDSLSKKKTFSNLIKGKCLGYFDATPWSARYRSRYRNDAECYIREQPVRCLAKLSGVTTCGYGCPALTMCGLTVTKNVQVFLLI